MQRIFLDANVLFSAAYLPESGLLELWRLPKAQQVQLVSSLYAVEEARRNLAGLEQQERLEALLSKMQTSETQVVESIEPSAPIPIELPLKDRPILSSAIAVKATHLLTGDFKHFGAYYGQSIQGVLILPPAAYLQQ